MSSAEYEDILLHRRFRSVANALMGKWFAETKSDALKWALKLTYSSKVCVIEIEIADDIGEALYFADYLDGVGPARYAEIDHLKHATILTVTDVLKK
ncbi:hypothetical protein GGR28_002364 [Lewinella aquimaris]|uniref:Uncharacterized protein n=1 Tax=Neolewinella aquimaris TaxID=1835722 RepID=A0A840ED61_9BACT|nr:hypothetical protein [Neolewinella aquimaris]